MNPALKLTTYLKEARIELKKVLWPSRKTTFSHTLMVIGFSVGVAIFLASIDYLFTYLYNVVVK